MQDCIEAAAKTAYIALGSPWENSYVESFNARLRDELLIARRSDDWERRKW